jgi:hypothetical protein
MKYIQTFEKFTHFDICPLCLDKYLNQYNVNESVSNISSLQINVPLKGCVNACKSCIARIHSAHLKMKEINNQVISEDKYLNSLMLVSNYCSNAVLTSDNGEPAQNMNFIKKFGELNKKLDKPFNIELQTTGVLMTDDNLKILKDINLKVVSLSVFDIINYQNNLNIIDVKNKLLFHLPTICKKIKDNGFILRISINLIKEYDKYTMEEIFNAVKELGADQLTFKNLWCTDDENPINKWIKINKASDNILDKISDYLDNNGDKISRNNYNYNGISIKLVDNCMMGNYLIIRSDGRLYDSWESCEPTNLNN